MRLAVFSDLRIWRTAAGFAAAPPGDVAELNALQELSGDLVVVGVAAAGQPPPHAEPLSARAHVAPIAMRSGGGLGGKPAAAADCLRAIPRLRAALEGVEMVQLRCPSKVAMAALGLLSLQLSRPRVWARWGGEWGARPREPWSYLLQRMVLRRRLAEVETTPVGPGGLPNPTRSRSRMTAADRATQDKQLTRPLRLLFPARLVEDKGGDQVLVIGAALARRGWRVRIDFAGDGPLRLWLEARARRLRLADSAVFHGWLGSQDLDRLAAAAHFVLLPSRTEGFPRALTDAMAFRCVPLASPVGAIPDALSSIDTGLLWPADRPELWANQIERIAFDPRQWRRLADQAQRQAMDYSVEAYGAAVLDFWERTWGLGRRAAGLEASR